MNFCKLCVYPESAVNIIFDENGVCSACNFAREYHSISLEEWKIREQRLFDEISIASGRSKSIGSYDCIVAVSGGKDSYWQTHLIKNVLGFKPLLVTYHGNNYSPEGERNLERMRKVFDVEHIIFRPSEIKLKKLNVAGFKLMGDMNWHAHAGIKTLPMQVAKAFRIPIVIWGEVTWSISGMFSPDDYVEYNLKTVKEHDLRGFTKKDFIGNEGVTESDLDWLEMPSDRDVAELGLRGLYVGNYYKWDANSHTKFVVENFGFEQKSGSFQRTYRTMSNLDDIHENGIHDYMKYLKFGYGRASDHASKDIRDGYISRSEGVELVRKYDHVFPSDDLERWLAYTGMSLKGFEETAEKFRNLKIWSLKRDGKTWHKDEVWDSGY